MQNFRQSLKLKRRPSRLLRRLLLQPQQTYQDLQTKLQAAEEAGRKIAGLLAETDIVKNSIANPEATETKINEEINLMFDSISALTK